MILHRAVSIPSRDSHETCIRILRDFHNIFTGVSCHSYAKSLTKFLGNTSVSSIELYFEVYAEPKSYTRIVVIFVAFCRAPKSRVVAFAATSEQKHSDGEDISSYYTA